MFKLQILWHYLRLTLRGKFADRQRLQHFQHQSWRRFVQKILPRSPFYRFFSEKKLPLENFPLQNKESFMAHFSAINTLGIQLDDALATALEAEIKRDFRPTLNGVTVGLSTGTSGKRGLFLVTDSERAQWTALVMSRVLRMNFLKRQKVAFFLRANSNLYSSVQSRLFEFQFFDIFRPVSALIADLQVFQPDIIAAQPSVMAELAAAQQNGSLTVKPKQLLSFAEVLWPDDRVFFEATFQAPLREVYQCTEGFLGVSCDYGTMHLNEDLFILEKRYLSEDRFVPIITDFTRTSQPMIRYELTDVLRERKTPCPCGSFFLGIEQIEGREDDVLVFSTKNGIEKIFPDLICRRIAQQTDQFRQYRITQTTEGNLLLELDASADDFAEIAVVIQKTILDLLAERQIFGIQFEIQQGILRQPGEKLRRVVRQKSI